MTEPEPPRKQARWKVEAGVAAALGLVVFACWWFFVREPTRFNVVLISIDSLRYDHVGCYGYPRPTTRALDALASHGARFETAHSTTTWTLPAHVALMTGLADDLHGVVVDYAPLDPNRTLLAEEFQRAGYETAGFYGGVYLDKAFGFDRGFRTYENCGVDVPRGREAQADHESHGVQTAPKTEAAAERFLAQRPADKPFFLFLHHWDVHFDYIAPKEYVDRFANGYRGTLDVSNFWTNDAIHAGMAPEDLQYVKACYDAQIAFVDDHLARLFAKLDELGLRETTYIIVTADHGEEFFDHGNKGHRLNLHEETLRIPLVVAGPGIAPRVITNPARLIDVMPTLLDLCDLPAARECLGVSLAPLLRGENPQTLRSLPIVAELTYLPKTKDAAGNWVEAGTYEKHQATSLNEWKLIEIRRRVHDLKKSPLNFAGKEVAPLRAQVFDLAHDPRETHDLASTSKDAWDKLWDFHLGFQTALAEMRKSLLTTDNPQPQQLDPAILEQMLENGYVSGLPHAPPPQPPMPNTDQKSADEQQQGANPSQDAKR